MNECRIAIYPFSRISFALLNYLQSSNCNITEVFSLYGFGIVGKDISESDARQKVNLIAKSGEEIINNLADFDTLLITEWMKPAYEITDSLIYQDIVQKIKLAAENGKNIICLPKLKKADLKEIKSLCQQQNIQFRYCPSELGDLDKYGHKKRYEFCPISIPVVLVGGIINDIDCFECFLGLVKAFQNAGYNVAGFASDSSSTLFNITRLDPIMNSLRYSDDEKMLWINNCLFYISLKKKADIIIIQIPDAMMRFNDQAINGFGAKTFVYSQAVTANYCFGIVPWRFTDSHFLDSVSNNFKNRYGFQLNGVFSSNFLINDIDLKYGAEINPVFFRETKHVPPNIKNNIPIYTFGDSTYYDLACKQAISDLCLDERSELRNEH